MSKFTLYRADVDSPRLARALGKVPGVAVGGEQADEATPDEPAGDAAAPVATDEGEDDGGLREKIPVPDTDVVDEEKGSVVKTYGLLGLGVSMVTLGIATVGIWVYLRRTGDGDESETPPPATGLDTAEPTPSTAGPATGGPESPTAATEPEPSERSMAAPDEQDEAEPHGRIEGDRSDVEWEPRDTTPASEPEPEPVETPDELAEKAAGEEADERPTESVDAAPLLGVAFLAASGAVVNWLRADTDET